MVVLSRAILRATEIERALGAAVIEPGLRAVLVIDADADELERLAATLAALFEAATKTRVKRVTLAPFHVDDDLYGTEGEGAPSYDEGGLPGAWVRRGLLVTPDDTSDFVVALLPDLANTSLAVSRAFVQLAEADLGRLERHGQRRAWRSRIAWIAGVATADIGRVSPHVLDRFALRVHGARQDRAARTKGLGEWLEGVRAVDAVANAEVSADIVARIRRARRKFVSVPDDFGATVLGLLGERASVGSRREVALARLAAALARLEGEPFAHRDHVRDAARLLGLSTVGGRAGARSVSERDHTDAAQGRTTADATTPTDDTAPVRGPGGELEGVVERAAAEIFEVEPSTVDSEDDIVALDPYPEDTAPVERDHAALRLPLIRGSGSMRERGPVVGTRRTTSTSDLAVVPTLFEAARYQTIRRRNRRVTDGRLLLSETDLRAWRRAPRADSMLALVLDLTSCRDVDWPAALAPFIRRAYVERSPVCTVLVGAARPDVEPASRLRSELRAECVVTRSVLVPEFSAALDRAPGRATPLAHGLRHALDTLRRALRRGRGAIDRGTLVVLSDGRGNVPLHASLEGAAPQRVGREGIDDALALARQLAGLHDIERVVLDPEPRYGSAVAELAEALEARVDRVGGSPS